MRDAGRWGHARTRTHGGRLSGRRARRAAAPRWPHPRRRRLHAGLRHSYGGRGGSAEGAAVRAAEEGALERTRARAAAGKATTCASTAAFPAKAPSARRSSTSSAAGESTAPAAAQNGLLLEEIRRAAWPPRRPPALRKQQAAWIPARRCMMAQSVNNEARFKRRRGVDCCRHLRVQMELRPRPTPG
jgi:hypothetical protein